MKLLFLRHGQTDYNKQKRMMGRGIDHSLNEDGIRQAQEVLKALDGNFEVIFSSPLKRAYETAEIIAQHFNKLIISRDELAERDYGTLAGKTWPEAAEITGNPELKEKDFRLEYDYRPYGGESVEDVRQRLVSFLDELKQKQEYQAVLIATHGGIIRLVNSILAGKAVREIDNASIQEFKL